MSKRVRAYVVSGEGEETYHSIRLKFKTTINEAEYETLLVGLTIARAMNAVEVKVKADFEIVVNQVQGMYVLKSERFWLYLQWVWEEHDLFWSLTNFSKGQLASG